MSHARTIEPAPTFVGVLRLAHYLEAAAQRRASVRLRLGVQSIDVGAIDIVDGEVVHAEMPGASGDRALDMLVRLRRLDVECGPLPADLQRDVAIPWRSLTSAAEALTESACEHLAAQFDGATGAPTPTAVPRTTPSAHVIEDPATIDLAPLRLLDGYVAAGVLDGSTGSFDDADGDDLELALAAAGMTELVATLRELGGGDLLELAVTTSSRHQLLSAVAGEGDRLLLLVVDRSAVSVAFAQHALRAFGGGAR